MARPKHPVTARIYEAIDLLDRNGMEVTPAAVKINVQKKITWADWTPEEASEEALEQRIARCFRDRGMAITDSAPRPGGRPRKEFWSSLVSELQEWVRIKEESVTYDRNRIKAEKAVIAFLREKESELGYEPYPGLFHAEIDRIYAMHHIAAPSAP